jgi:hypothetical protein
MDGCHADVKAYMKLLFTLYKDETDEKCIISTPSTPFSSGMAAPISHTQNLQTSSPLTPLEWNP